MEYTLTTCIVAVQFGEAAGLSELELRDVYYEALCATSAVTLRRTGRPHFWATDFGCACRFCLTRHRRPRACHRVDAALHSHRQPQRRHPTSGADCPSGFTNVGDQLLPRSLRSGSTLGHTPWFSRKFCANCRPNLCPLGWQRHSGACG